MTFSVTPFSGDTVRLTKLEKTFPQFPSVATALKHLEIQGAAAE